MTLILINVIQKHDSEQHSRYFNQTFWVMGNRGESGIMPSKWEWIEMNWNGFRFSEILIHEC